MSGTLRSAPSPALVTGGPLQRFGRGKTVGIYGGCFSRARLPSDSTGTFALTLTNVAPGSAVQVELAGSGDPVSNTTAATSTVVLTLPAYSAGNTNNNLRVKVRKGSASPFYQPYETLVTAFVGAQSVYVSQIPDE